jgi:hypothetical protein
MALSLSLIILMLRYDESSSLAVFPILSTGYASAEQSALSPANIFLKSTKESIAARF